MRADHRELSRVAREVLPSLIARFGGGELGELEIRQSGWRVRLRRQDGMSKPPQAVTARRGSSSTRSSGGGAAGPAPGNAPQSGTTDGGRVAVTSPAVGYFQPASGLVVGLRVRSGDALGHVDVLGVRHDAVVGTDGVVSRLLAEPGQAVEYGQELVRLERVPAGDPRDDGRRRPVA